MENSQVYFAICCRVGLGRHGPLQAYFNPQITPGARLRQLRRRQERPLRESQVPQHLPPPPPCPTPIMLVLRQLIMAMLPTPHLLSICPLGGTRLPCPPPLRSPAYRCKTVLQVQLQRLRRPLQQPPRHRQEFIRRRRYPEHQRQLHPLCCTQRRTPTCIIHNR